MVACQRGGPRSKPCCKSCARGQTCDSETGGYGIVEPFTSLDEQGFAALIPLILGAVQGALANKKAGKSGSSGAASGALSGLLGGVLGGPPAGGPKLDRDALIALLLPALLQAMRAPAAAEVSTNPGTDSGLTETARRERRRRAAAAKVPDLTDVPGALAGASAVAPSRRSALDDITSSATRTVGGLGDIVGGVVGLGTGVVSGVGELLGSLFTTSSMPLAREAKSKKELGGPYSMSRTDRVVATTELATELRRLARALQRIADSESDD